VTDDRPPALRKGNVVPLLRRAGEAVKVIFGLADSVTELKTKNDALFAKVAELRRDVDQQAGQVKVLMGFVQSALNDRVREQAEAAVRAILAERGNKPGTKRPGKKKQAIRQSGSEPRRGGRS
jgi:hypothetical protein